MHFENERNQQRESRVPAHQQRENNKHNDRTTHTHVHTSNVKYTPEYISVLNGYYLQANHFSNTLSKL